MALNLKKLASPLLAASLLMPSVNAFASPDPFNDENPTALAMWSDLLVLRPLGMVVTAVGAVGYVISLPFTLPAGSSKETGYVMVVEPAMYTFVRCLGCSRPGYHGDSAEEEAIEEAAEQPPK